ncbi:hypothetical protein Tco_0153350 [Tanacetum coccineum]
MPTIGTRPIEFNVGDLVMLKVSPWKGVLRFKNKGKKCLSDELRLITLDDVEIDLEITTREKPVAILGRKSRQLHNKEMPLVKVQWKHRKGTSIRHFLEGVSVCVGVDINKKKEEIRVLPNCIKIESEA